MDMRALAKYLCIILLQLKSIAFGQQPLIQYQEIPIEIRSKWEEAGAEYGHLVADKYGNMTFAIEHNGENSVPGFRIAVCTLDKLGSLPAPNMSFGLWMGGSHTTNESLIPLERFENLEVLYLAKARISDIGIKNLAKNRSLRVINLEKNRLTSDSLNNISDLRQLEFLNLSWTRIDGKGIRALSRLKKLRVLSLDATGISKNEIKELHAFPALENLSLKYNSVESSLPSLGKISTLKSLDLSSTSFTGRGLGEFAITKRLRELKLAYNSLDSEGMKELKLLRQLEVLDLSYNESINDESMSYVGRLTELRDLNLDATGVNNEAIFKLRELAKLGKLKLRHTNVTDEAVLQISKNWDLIFLALPVSITDKGIESLADQRKLISIDLEDTKITDVGLRTLSGLKSIRYLNLGNTSISDAGLIDRPMFCGHRVKGVNFSKRRNTHESNPT